MRSFQIMRNTGWNLAWQGIPVLAALFAILQNFLGLGMLAAWYAIDRLLRWVGSKYYGY